METASKHGRNDDDEETKISDKASELSATNALNSLNFPREKPSVSSAPPSLGSTASCTDSNLSNVSTESHSEFNETIRAVVYSKLASPKDYHKRMHFNVRGKSIKFPVKLMYTLEECTEFSDIISWSEDGLSFIIHDTQRLEEHILPILFKVAKYSSFKRKMYRWGFTKKNVGDLTELNYRHSNFKKGNYSLCVEITCNKNDTIIPLSLSSLNSLHAQLEITRPSTSHNANNMQYPNTSPTPLNSTPTPYFQSYGAAPESSIDTNYHMNDTQHSHQYLSRISENKEVHYGLNQAIPSTGTGDISDVQYAHTSNMLNHATTNMHAMQGNHQHYFPQAPKPIGHHTYGTMNQMSAANNGMLTQHPTHHAAMSVAANNKMHTRYPTHNAVSAANNNMLTQYPTHHNAMSVSNNNMHTECLTNDAMPAVNKDIFTQYATHDALSVSTNDIITECFTNDEMSVSDHDMLTECFANDEMSVSNNDMHTQYSAHHASDHTYHQPHQQLATSDTYQPQQQLDVSASYLPDHGQAPPFSLIRMQHFNHAHNNNNNHDNDDTHDHNATSRRIIRHGGRY